MRHLSQLILKSLLGSAIFLSSVASALSQVQPQKVQFLLDWKADPGFAGLYVARELGFYKKRGVEVELIEGTGATVSAQLIGTGKYKIGTSSGEAAVIARSKGVPVSSVAVFYPKVSTVIVSRADTPIRRPEDLIGKQIGLINGSITVDEYRGILAANNIDRSKIQEVDIGFDVAPLLTKQVDALMQYEELSVELRLQGHDVVLMRLADFGLNAYSFNLIVNDDAARREPQLIRAVVEGSIEGYEYLRQNPTEAAALFSRLYPERRKEFIQESIKIVARMLGTGPVGRQDPRGWQATIDTLNNLGLLARKVTVDEVALKEYLQDQK